MASASRSRIPALREDFCEAMAPWYLGLQQTWPDLRAEAIRQKWTVAPTMFYDLSADPMRRLFVCAWLWEAHVRGDRNVTLELHASSRPPSFRDIRDHIASLLCAGRLSIANFSIITSDEEHDDVDDITPSEVSSGDGDSEPLSLVEALSAMTALSSVSLFMTPRMMNMWLPFFGAACREGAANLRSLHLWWSKSGVCRGWEEFPDVRQIRTLALERFHHVATPPLGQAIAEKFSQVDTLVIDAFHPSEHTADSMNALLSGMSARLTSLSFKSCRKFDVWYEPISRMSQLRELTLERIDGAIDSFATLGVTPSADKYNTLFDCLPQLRSVRLHNINVSSYHFSLLFDLLGALGRSKSLRELDISTEWARQGSREFNDFNCQLATVLREGPLATCALTSFGLCATEFNLLRIAPSDSLFKPATLSTHLFTMLVSVLRQEHGIRSTVEELRLGRLLRVHEAATTELLGALDGCSRLRRITVDGDFSPKVRKWSEERNRRTQPDKAAWAIVNAGIQLSQERRFMRAMMGAILATPKYNMQHNRHKITEASACSYLPARALREITAYLDVAELECCSA